MIGYNRGNLSETARSVGSTRAASSNHEGIIFMATWYDSTTALNSQQQASADLLNKRARNSEPYFWNDDIEQATGRAFQWLCPFCGVDLRQTGYHKAHISPVGSGVGVVPGNIVLSCPECNMDMHSRHAYTYCQQKRIPFANIGFTLEILARIFPIALIERVERHKKAPNARTLAEQW